MAQEAEFGNAIKTISNLKTAEDLQRKLDSLRRGRQPMENQWKVNLAFYKGRQYTYYNRHTRRLESRPVDDGELPRYIVRLVSNQILTGSHSLLAKYTKTKPVMTASPGSGSEHDFKAAQMAERLLEYWWESMYLDDRLAEALLWGIIAGQGFWKISWDEHAGKPMRFLLDPQGQPILNDGLKDAFRAQLEQMGVPPQEQTVYMGDIKIETISPFDVYLDPSANVFEDCKYAICVHHMDPDDIKTRWGLDVKPDSVNVSADASLPFGKSDESEPTVKAVNIAYFRPSPALPKGRYVVWVDKPQKILEDSAWPYHGTMLPLVKFPGVRVPGQIYDSSIVEHAIPLQKELNRTISQIVEYKNLTIKPRYWAPHGSTQQRITSEPGAIYFYTPYDNMKPEPEQLPSMPPYVFDHLQGIRNGLREVFALTEVTEGEVPPNVEAGIAIDLLQEMATDRLAPTINLIEETLGRAGQIMLSLAQQYYVEPRLLKIKGSGGSVQVKRFTQADIDGGISVSVEAGSALPRTRAGKQARILDYIDRGVLRPDQAYKYLDMGDMAGVARAFQADDDQISREHEKLISGEPINTYAASQAMMEVQSGTNPHTGQPWASMEEAIDYVDDASMKPFPFENLQSHAEGHALFMKSVEFEGLPDDAKERFYTHYIGTVDQLATQQPQPEPIAPRVSLQLKGTTGPTGAAEIINAAGVEGVTPEIMTEPPLETWVSDNMDKPDADEAGNDALSEADLSLRAQEMAHKEELQRINSETAKMKIAHETQKLGTQQALDNQKVALAQKKTEQSDFKPKPKESDGG